MPVLSCDEITKSFGGTQVLRGLSFELDMQEFLCLLGPSGCGKTTLLRIIAGLEMLNGGEIRLNGKVVSTAASRVPPQHRRIGLVFQDVALFPHLTVAQNIAFGLKGGERRNARRIDELLELINLPGYQKSYPYEISGGQQQRVALARALAPNPEPIMLDEPFSSLDAQLRNQVRDELHRVLRDAGVGAILVTHDQSEAFGFADRVLVLSEGRVVQEGAPEEIYTEPVSPWGARFVGESNFVSVRDLRALIDNPEELSDLDAGAEVLVRPEAFSVKPADMNGHNAVIETVRFGGNHVDLTVRLARSVQRVQLMVGFDRKWENGQPVMLQVARFRHFG
ncbi:MAG: ABC transporter ATP-binding protein [Pseudomonadota bacterium]